MESESRKRDRDEEDPVEDDFDDVKQRRSLSDLFSKDDDDAVFAAENLEYDHDLVSGVMKSLADEIIGSNPTATSSETLPCVHDSKNDINVVSDENSCNAAANVDLEYLLGATDDELGIPPSPNCVADSVDGVAVNSDLFETPRFEPQAEEVLQFCDSDSWCLTYECEAAMLNESLCQDWQTRSLQGDAINDCCGTLSMDKTRMQLLESGVGM